MRLSLRSKILIAILAAVIATDLLAAWAVNGRIEAGARRESDGQARAQAAQARALYAERAATLTAEGEAVSLYPAVITAIDGENAMPLLRWSSQLAQRQGTSVTVVNKDGKVVARGHDPQRAGDDLASKLEGLRLALAGEKRSGAEDGDELGLALRGYAPVRRGGVEGPIVGAVMLADPFDDRLLDRLAGGEGYSADLRVEPGASGTDRCDTPQSGPATCRFSVPSPAGRPVASIALAVPLTEIQQARADARRALWSVGALVLLLGAAATWLLARSLTGPLGRLTASAHRIAAGDFSQPAGVRGADEIGTLARALDTMRERVGEATGALRGERDVLDAVLESTGDGILMTDHQGKVAVSNGRWPALLGGEGLAAAAGLSRIGGASGSFTEAAGGWLKDPERVAGADFERFDPYRRFRCYTAPVRLPEREQGTGNRGQGTGDREQGTGNRGRGTGNRTGQLSGGSL
jgi:HAMP domain-containing protein